MLSTLNKKLLIILGVSSICFNLTIGVNASRSSQTCTGGTSDSTCNTYKLSGQIVPYCYNNEKEDYASNCLTISLTNRLSHNSSVNKYDIIKDYCNSVLSDSQRGGRIYFASKSLNNESWDWKKTFDSQNSIFVTALCSSFTKGEATPLVANNGSNGSIMAFLTGDISNVLGLEQKTYSQSERKDFCSISDYPGLDYCDMSVYATDIFSAVMSDIFKIKYAQALHVDSVENFASKEDRITAFLSGYFTLDDDYKTLKNDFPQTISVLNSNQTLYKNALESVKILKNGDIASLASTLGCTGTNNITGTGFIACALHGSNGKESGLDPAFVTMFYNEILNYRLFIKYYSHRLNDKIIIATKSDDSNKEIYESEYADFDKLSNLQIKAATQTLHDYEDLVQTYPLHIGLLLYQEEMLTFRNKHLSPIVTQFYSLSEKLQNVQLKNS